VGQGRASSELAFVAAALPAYDIGAVLGRGTCGLVVAGRHRRLERDVAIKLLPEGLEGATEARHRFITEAQLLARMSHPHIVALYDFVEHDGSFLLVMERLDGGSLRRWVTRDRPLPNSCAAILAACAGLEHAHQRGILHRDVKPENLLFGTDGVLRLTDFGIAKAFNELAVAHTTPGYVLGTPHYLAPEQTRSGAELGPATDVYGAGTVLYELLSGRRPFDVADPVATLYERVHQDAAPLIERRPDVPAAVAAVVDRSIARDPTERFPSAAAFGQALAQAGTTAWGARWWDAMESPVRVGEELLDLSPPLAPGTVRTKQRGYARDTRSRRGRAIALGVLAIAACVALIFAVLDRDADEDPGAGSRTEAGVGSFTVRPDRGPPGTEITVTAQQPCPPAPKDWRDPSVLVLIFDPRKVAPEFNGYIASEDFPLTSDGLWSGRLTVPADASVGTDAMHVNCTAVDLTGQRQKYQSYSARVPYVVTAE
jgi:hypothetical protein